MASDFAQNQLAPAVSARKLSKRFGRRKALADCSFELPQGASLVIFGPNGAGKSTLLRLMSTLDRPSGGTLAELGLDVRKQAGEVRARLGVVSHAPMLYPDLTAQENLLFYARLYGVPNPHERVGDLLDFVELSVRRADAVRGFSRGMAQRLSLARALVNDPSLVLLDEPYSGLDPHAARIVDALFSNTAVLSHSDAPRTLVSVSHDIERGYSQATHAMLLSRGRQELYGSVAEISLDDLRCCFEEHVGGEV